MIQYRLYCPDCNQDFYADKETFTHACAGKDGEVLEKEAKLSPDPDKWKCENGHKLHTDKVLKSVGYYCLECRKKGNLFEKMDEEKEDYGQKYSF